MATLFEAPLATPEYEFEGPGTGEWEMPEATQYNPEFEYEFEGPGTGEWEMPEAAQYNPEFEYEFEGPGTGEWEMPEATQYNPEFEYEFEGPGTGEWEMPEATQYNPEFEYEFEGPGTGEWEMPEATQYNPEFEGPGTGEWEMPEATQYNPEFEGPGTGEWEADQFVGRALTRRLGSVAKRMAPGVAGKLAGMIPGAGLVAGPLAARLTASLVREGELETLEMEAHLFGTSESNPEVGAQESSQEAALTELLAAEAAAASSEAPAVSVLSASLPVTISIMGGRRRLRRIMPALTQANARLVRSLASQGPAGRQLLRAVPSIQRQAVATLRAATRQGRPVTSPLAVAAMAAAANNVLANPRRVGAIVHRNRMLRQRVAPPVPRTGFGASYPPYRRSVYTPNSLQPMTG